MRILIVAERLPSPLGGGAARQYNLIRALAGQHQYSIITHAFPEDLRLKNDLAKMVERLDVIEIQPPVAENHSNLYWRTTAWQHALFDPLPKRGRPFQTPAIRKVISDRLSSQAFDLIQVHQAYMSPVVPDTPIPILLDMHDILSDYEAEFIKGRKKTTHRLQAWLEWKKIARLEKEAVQRCQICTLVSETDQDRLLQSFPLVKTMVVPNGVDTAYFYSDPEPASSEVTPPQVTFTGSMNYPPNADAVRWFCQRILPMLCQIQPHVRVKIVGWDPPEDIRQLHMPPDIEVTGYVDDIRPYLAQSTAIIVPIRLGSGTRLKILDAWAMGKAVVSTPLGAQGLLATHAENILLAETPEEFAAAINELICKPELRKKIGSTARKTVETHYSWVMISKQMQSAYENAVKSN